MERKEHNVGVAYLTNVIMDGGGSCVEIEVYVDKQPNSVIRKSLMEDSVLFGAYGTMVGNTLIEKGCSRCDVRTDGVKGKKLEDFAKTLREKGLEINIIDRRFP